SVLDAISFALFSSFPSLENRKITLAEVIRHGAMQARINLSLEWNGGKYEIVRAISKDAKDKVTSSAEIRKDGQLVEKGQSAVTKYIQQLLSIDYPLFSRAIYSAQNRIDYFLSIEPGKRKDEIDSLLGLDRFERARENSVTLINRLRFAKRSHETKFDRKKLDEMRSKEQQAKEELEKLEASKIELTKKVAAHRNLYYEASTKFSALKEKKEKFLKLREKIVALKATIEQISEQLKGKQPQETELAALKSRKIELSNLLMEKRSFVNSLQEKYNSYSKQFGSLEMKIEESTRAEAEKKSLQNELSSSIQNRTHEELIIERNKMENELVDLEATVKNLISSSARIENSIGALSPSLSKCPVCSHQLTKDSIIHVIEEHRKEIQSNKIEVERIVPLRKNLIDKLILIKERIRRTEFIIQKISMLDKSIANLVENKDKKTTLMQIMEQNKAELTRARSNQEKFMLELKGIESEYSELEKNILAAKRLSHLSKELSDSEKSSLLLVFEESEFENKSKECEQLKLNAERVAMELSSLDSRSKSSKDILALTSSEVKTLEDLNEAINNLSVLEEELSLFRNAIIETQAELRKEVIEAINAAMNSIWPVLYPYNDYTELKITTNSKGYSFELYDGEWRSVELVSGGERATVALVFRTALATVLTPNMSMLVLDEPTHNLDKEAVAVLANALQYRLPEIIEQSFVITHEEGLMGSEFASTYRLGREKSPNSSTFSEEV
ncbi:SMC family ATPase, partial [Candidatus Micrarchaeota archaeon]|nr:SMC family ATPase [Candidatus Micrarchaeota archaeon]